MEIKVFAFAVLTLALFGSPAMSEETIQTSDGRSIVLKDDGTYVLLTQPSKAATVDEMAFVDVVVDANTLAGKRIETTGILRVVGGFKFLYDTNGGFGAYIKVETNQLSRESQKSILVNCADFSKTCTVHLGGKVGIEYGVTSLFADRLTID
jgi:hypothetical protein